MFSPSAPSDRSTPWFLGSSSPSTSTSSGHSGRSAPSPLTSSGLPAGHYKLEQSIKYLAARYHGCYMDRLDNNIIKPHNYVYFLETFNKFVAFATFPQVSRFTTMLKTYTDCDLKECHYGERLVTKVTFGTNYSDYAESLCTCIRKILTTELAYVPSQINHSSLYPLQGGNEPFKVYCPTAVNKSYRMMNKRQITQSKNSAFKKL